MSNGFLQVEAILNAWGAEGWEVVNFAVVARSGTGGVGRRA